jgi:hypothetical protein
MNDVTARINYMEACSDKPPTMKSLETMKIYRDDFDWMISTIEELLQYQEQAQESAKTIYRLNKRIEELEITNKNLVLMLNYH